MGIVIDHPRVREIEIKHQLGRQEAENFLRGLAGSDASAAKAVADIDSERKDRLAAVTKANFANAAALGLSMDAVATLVAKLVADTKLFTWLCQRVHVTMAHDRPLAHSE